MRRLNIIVAADENNVIGKDNDLIWHLPDDLKHFKSLTSGHPIIMGRKTFESIGKALPNRTNVIISRNSKYNPEGCITVNSLDKALEICEDAPEVFIIGGAQIYSLALDRADRVYLTRVHARLEGDRHFPILGPDWVETRSELHPSDEKHAFSFTIKTYERP